MSTLTALNQYSVLYVEDELKIQASVAEYLSNYFSCVHLAETGKDTLALYQQHKPEVLLLDINLPDIDGLTIAKKIREQDSAIKIIMLTAYSEKEKLLKATELKLTKYLVKPVAPKVFKEMLTVLAHELANTATQYVRLGEGYHWNKNEAKLYGAKGSIALTEKEHRLLMLFIQHKEKMVTYQKISYMVWDNSDDKDVSHDSIKNQVSQLRKHLPANSIVSVYGEGYRLK